MSNETLEANMSKITTEVMGRVADMATGRPEFKSISLEYPGYLDVTDRKGRVYLIGENEGKWAIDCYNSEDHVQSGYSPTDAGDLDVPDNTTDPALVVDALARYVEGWDGSAGWWQPKEEA